MTGLKVLLDTNAIIALQRDNLDLKKLLSTVTDVFIPLIAVGELYFGAHKSQRVAENRQQVTDFMVNRVVLNPDTDTANLYGEIKQRHGTKGRPIPENDIWIAALTIQYGLTLITNDAHFEEIDTLTSQGWK